MENLLIINNEKFVKVTEVDETFIKCYKVHRKYPHEKKFHEGIPFINKDKAVEYAKDLEKILGMQTLITDFLLYI